MPDGNRVGSARRLPLASRVAAIQQSSMLTYRYPSRSSPLATTASAIPLIRFSSMLQPNLFQLFQPIGGAALGPIGVAAVAGTADGRTTAAATNVTRASRARFMGNSRV